MTGTIFQARRRRSFKNSFQTRLYGELTESDRQTRIRCVFTVSKSAVISLMVLIGFVTVPLGGGILAFFVMRLLEELGFSRDLLDDLWLPLDLFFGGWLLVHVQRWKSQSELIDFVCMALHADQPNALS